MTVVIVMAATLLKIAQVFVVVTLLWMTVVIVMAVTLLKIAQVFVVVTLL
jgi:hypothetical protein